MIKITCANCGAVFPLVGTIVNVHGRYHARILRCFSCSKCGRALIKEKKPVVSFGV